MTFKEASKPTLHLFRSLLRAATYLPDSAARSYFHKYIITRFRETIVVTPERLRKGRQSLGILERACHGENDPLHKVIFMTYGRSGKRRRELIVELQKTDEEDLPADSDSLKALIEKARHGEAASTTRRHPKLMALVKSMNNTYSEESLRPIIRNIIPNITPLNAKGRPLSFRKQKSDMRRWWAKTLDRISPPLPAHEWNRLRDLISGKIPFEAPPARRSRPAEVDHKKPTDFDYFTKPISTVLRRDSMQRSQSLSRHNITPTYMRRLWSLVWRNSPLMMKNQESGVWDVVWGHSRSSLDKGNISAARTSDIELFEGAQLYGKPISRSKSTVEKKLNM